MSHRSVPPDYLRALQEHARRAGASLVPITDPAVHDQLIRVIADAARQQRETPGYPSELRMWTNRLLGGRDGVPPTNVAATPIGATAASPLRRFGRTALAQPVLGPGRSPDDDAADLLVITTPGDDTLERLRAGEATSAVLLAATRIGLATTPLSQALEIDSTRRRLRIDVLHVPEHPQLVIRIGWPAAGAAPIPQTPRRELTSVLLPG